MESLIRRPNFGSAMDALRSPGFVLFLVVVWVIGEGPSYEYEPFHWARTVQQAPPLDPYDLALRAQNAQYRSIYRNKNYFVQPPQKTTTWAPPQAPSSAFMRRTYAAASSSSTTTAAAATDSISDSPIVFEEQSSPANYIRTVETFQQSTSVVTNQVTSGSGNVIAGGRALYFPTPNGKITPTCAKNSLYCETFDSYPKELLNEVLTRTFTPKEFRDVYGETVDNSTTTTDLKLLERTGLISSNYEETPLCSSVERTIYPRVARNKDNKWMYVVNHDEYIQGVRVEKCLDDDGQPCVFGETAPAGYQTACRQKYIYKKLLALTPEGKTSTDTFKLPSCCVCFVKKVPLVNRVLNTSPAAMTSRQPPTEDHGHNNPDYDDLPTTTTTKSRSLRTRH